MHQIIGRRKSEALMMRETVGERRRMLLPLQEPREYAAVLVISKRLSLRDPGQ